MRRGLWFAAGAGAGVYAAARARRVAEAFTVDGLRDRWHGLRAGAGVFAAEASVARAEKESELRDRLGLVPDGTPELTPPADVTALDSSRATRRVPPEQEGSS